MLFIPLHYPSNAGLQTLRKEFLVGYLQAVDGERDPENLMLIFEMNSIVIEHFPLGMFWVNLQYLTIESVGVGVWKNECLLSN